MQITPAAIQSIYWNVLAGYEAAYARTPTWYPKVATEIPSTTRQNRYAWMDILGARMRKWVGERYKNNVAARAYTLENDDYELTVELDRNDIEDDNFGVFTPMVAQMGSQAAKWPDDLITQVIQSGVSTMGFDGQNFFSDSHPVNLDDPNTAVYSNNFALALTSANYSTVKTAMRSYLGADGKPIAINPRLMIVPPQLEDTANQILHADFTAPAAAFGQNAANAVQSNVLKGSSDLLVIEELANEPTTWYQADVSKAIKPFVFQLRKAPQLVTFTDPNSENVFWRKKFTYGIDSRGAAGFTLPFLIARSKP